jgi:hypothetical protein
MTATTHTTKFIRSDVMDDRKKRRYARVLRFTVSLMDARKPIAFFRYDSEKALRMMLVPLPSTIAASNFLQGGGFIEVVSAQYAGNVNIGLRVFSLRPSNTVSEDDALSLFGGADVIVAKIDAAIDASEQRQANENAADDRLREARHIARVLAERADKAARVLVLDDALKAILARFTTERKRLLAGLVEETKGDPTIVDESGNVRAIDPRVLAAALGNVEKYLPEPFPSFLSARSENAITEEDVR